MFPPNFKRKEAIDILLNFERGNDDGTGYAYIDSENKKFKCIKWPKTLSKVLEKTKDKFLSHMPHNGWTIAHVRAASHGENTHENTHPFLINDFAFIHNGVWSEYNVAASIMEKLKLCKFKGETDSEVAAQYLNLVGLEEFTLQVSGGVFVALKSDGSLIVSKTSGDLVSRKMNGIHLLASELSYLDYGRRKDLKDGWYIFNKNGELIKHKNNPTANTWYGSGSFGKSFEIDIEDVEDDKDPKRKSEKFSVVNVSSGPRIMGGSGLSIPSNYYPFSRNYD
jgi:glutamine phosphoribosylpyrophosphate amidotransferase